jgi:hypothetical protein
MRRPIPFLVLLAWLLAAMAAGPTPSTRPAAAPSASLDDYRVVWTRNVFARDRSAYRERPPVRFSPPRPVEHPVVLTGVVVQDALQVAFFEDTRTGETVRVSPGQALGDGTVTAVSLDSVEYRYGEVTRTIMLGENLSGVATSLYPLSVPGAPATATSEPTSAASEPASEPSGTSGRSTNDVLERMRLRRSREMRQ